MSVVIDSIQGKHAGAMTRLAQFADELGHHDDHARMTTDLADAQNAFTELLDYHKRFKSATRIAITRARASSSKKGQ